MKTIFTVLARPGPGVRQLSFAPHCARDRIDGFIGAASAGVEAVLDKKWPIARSAPLNVEPTVGGNALPSVFSKCSRRSPMRAAALVSATCTRSAPAPAPNHCALVNTRVLDVRAS